MESVGESLLALPLGTATRNRPALSVRALGPNESSGIPRLPGAASVPTSQWAPPRGAKSQSNLECTAPNIGAKAVAVGDDECWPALQQQVFHSPASRPLNAALVFPSLFRPVELAAATCTRSRSDGLSNHTLRSFGTATISSLRTGQRREDLLTSRL